MNTDKVAANVPLTTANWGPFAVKAALEADPKQHAKNIQQWNKLVEANTVDPTTRVRLNEWPTTLEATHPSAQRMDKKLGKAKGVWLAERKVVSDSDRILRARNVLISLGVDPSTKTNAENVQMYEVLANPPTLLVFYARTVIFFRKMWKTVKGWF